MSARGTLSAFSRASGTDAPNDAREARADAYIARTPAQPLLDAKQAGALLNVPASWVLAEARADRIPHVRLGKYVRFDVAELDAWWRARARGPWRSRGAAASRAHSVRIGPQPGAHGRESA
jgi:excisionase family DNA binding protein